MELKKIGIAFLRVFGVCALIGGMVLLLVKLESREAVFPAELISIGTKEDADCTVLLSNGSCVMIDTGESQDGAHILQVLKDHQIEAIDLLILTHPDKDHVGSAAFLLDNLEVGTVVLPYFSGSKAVYDELMLKMEQERVPMLTLSRDRLFTVNDLRIRVFAPEDFYYDDSNNYSLATLVEHGAVRMFFAGDAKGARLEEVQSLQVGEVDFYKTAYHGRDTRMSTMIIEELSPQYAVVTAPEEGKETKKAFAAAGTRVFYSVPQDHVFLSDGNTLTVKQAE